MLKGTGGNTSQLTCFAIIDQMSKALSSELSGRHLRNPRGTSYLNPDGSAADPEERICTGRVGARGCEARDVESDRRDRLNSVYSLIALCTYGKVLIGATICPKMSTNVKCTNLSEK